MTRHCPFLSKFHTMWPIIFVLSVCNSLEYLKITKYRLATKPSIISNDVQYEIIVIKFLRRYPIYLIIRMYLKTNFDFPVLNLILFYGHLLTNSMKVNSRSFPFSDMVCNSFVQDKQDYSYL